MPQTSPRGESVCTRFNVSGFCVLPQIPRVLAVSEPTLLSSLSAIAVTALVVYSPDLPKAASCFWVLNENRAKHRRLKHLKSQCSLERPPSNSSFNDMFFWVFSRVTTCNMGALGLLKSSFSSRVYWERSTISALIGQANFIFPPSVC